MPELSPGDVFGGYRIAGVADAATYGATEIRLGRPVLLRLLAPELGTPERERLLRVARALAQLAHPNIVPVHGAGEEDGRAYIAFGPVPGRRLDELIAEEGPFDAERAVRIVEAVAGALDAAHRRGLTHGDVAARTVLVSRKGETFLADFGKVSGRDARADVRGLGAVLFELLTGRAPADGAPAPVSAGVDAPPLDAVLVRALATDPDAGYGSAGELARAAAAALREPDQVTRPGATTVVRPLPDARLGGILAPTAPLGPRKLRPEEQPTVPRTVVKPPPPPGAA